ncbi:cytochrome P450 [Clathrospora elynae]|uniref:Cytochrome P450 n=1 Tax=Clathrospora elynae TaxID=706981 RepID=A0A6A5SZK6_9PLEO|nr:cytochrome P450 [Clathrospora elynae]
MGDTLYAILALLPVVSWFLYYQLGQWRHKPFAHIPSKLSTNLFLGHLGHIAAQYKKVGSSDVHPDYVLENIWKENGSPEFMIFDTRPISHALLLVASHEIAEQITKASKTQQYSVTKSPTMQEGFGQLVGKYSLLSQEGESWKGLRKTFNPSFAPQHLLSLLPVIVEKTYTLMDKLDDLARSGIATEMEPYCTNVTFDIIGEVVTNVDCKAQDNTVQGDDIVRNFRILCATFAGDNGGLSASWLNLPKRIKKYIYSQRLDAAVKKCVTEKFTDIKAAQKTKTKLTKDRSVLALALKDIQVLTPYDLQSIADQVKTFFFAGHDTTSILLQRLFYALSVHPHCLAKIRAEHDAIFGDSGPREVFLAHPDETMKALKYTSACIKEALRLWPPAGSARMSHNGFKLRTSDGDEVCVDKCVLYLCHHLIQRDPKVYGETANDFVPERWVGDADTSSANTDDDGSSAGASKIPISAWRAFERGPRSCIGQELANMEARVILACVMRRYDFVKVGVGEVDTDGSGKGVVDKKGKLKTKSELLSVSRRCNRAERKADFEQTMAITSKVIDKTVMRVKFHEKTG